jgi:chromosome segregation ATPase
MNWDHLFSLETGFFLIFVACVAIAIRNLAVSTRRLDILEFVASDLRDKLQYLEGQIETIDHDLHDLEQQLDELAEAIAEATKGASDFAEFQDLVDEELETRGIR